MCKIEICFVCHGLLNREREIERATKTYREGQIESERKKERGREREREREKEREGQRARE